MNLIDAIVSQLESNLQMFKQHLADFSEDDFFTRPCAGANHPAWQLGHLCKAEAFMIDKIKPGSQPMPAGWVEKFLKETAGSDVRSEFPSKDEIIAMFTTVRGRTIEAARSFRPDELEQPSGIGFAPTVGATLFAQPGHAMMHIGQIQVLRRKLGKPLLF